MDETLDGRHHCDLAGRNRLDMSSNDLPRKAGHPTASGVFASGRHCFQMDGRLGSVPGIGLGDSHQIELAVVMNFLQTEVGLGKKSHRYRTEVRDWGV